MLVEIIVGIGVGVAVAAIGGYAAYLIIFGKIQGKVEIIETYTSGIPEMQNQLGKVVENATSTKDEFLSLKKALIGDGSDAGRLGRIEDELKRSNAEINKKLANIDDKIMLAVANETKELKAFLREFSERLEGKDQGQAS